MPLETAILRALDVPDVRRWKRNRFKSSAKLYICGPQEEQWSGRSNLAQRWWCRCSTPLSAAPGMRCAGDGNRGSMVPPSLPNLRVGTPNSNCFITNAEEV